MQRTFVITGASSGIGEALAKSCASLGDNVVLAARAKDAIERVAAECERAGGKPTGRSPRDEDGGATMSVDECTRLVVRAIDRRDRELVMTRTARAGMWLKLVAPALVDRMALRAVRKKDWSRARPRSSRRASRTAGWSR